MATPSPLRPTAPGVHLAIPSPKDARTIVRSIVNVLRDSNQTVDIVVGEELTSRAQMRFLLEHGAMATEAGRALLRDRPALRDTDVGALRRLPDGTLGRELARYLDANGFDYDVDAAAPPLLEDPDEAYVLQRIRKNHDLWHVLLGLGPAGHEEVLVHAFTLGQVGMPSSVAIVTLGAIKHMVLEKRWGCLRRSLLDAYRLGRSAHPLVTVRWEELWDVPVDALRRRFGLHPIDAIGVASA